MIKIKSNKSANKLFAEFVDCCCQWDDCFEIIEKFMDDNCDYNFFLSEGKNYKLDHFSYEFNEIIKLCNKSLKSKQDLLEIVCLHDRNDDCYDIVAYTLMDIKSFKVKLKEEIKKLNDSKKIS